MNLTMNNELTYTNHLWILIQKNPNKQWNWREISRNPNITWEIIQNNPDKPWNWRYIAWNKFEKHPVIKRKKEKAWLEKYFNEKLQIYLNIAKLLTDFVY